MKKIRTTDLIKMKEEGRKITVLTSYNHYMARLVEDSEVPVILVGDSLGMVEQGLDTTLPVTLDEMIYHTRNVVRGAKKSLVITDLPFGTYNDETDAVENSVLVLKESGASAVKLEGGVKQKEKIRAIVDVEIPVMAHIGLTPQSVHKLGGYKMQGKGKEEKELIIEDALAVEEAGAFSVVLECIPSELAKIITEKLSIPTIGIGSGPYTDGQVLVINDMLGLTGGEKAPSFVKPYANLDETVKNAITSFKDDVEKNKFNK